MRVLRISKWVFGLSFLNMNKQSRIASYLRSNFNLKDKDQKEETNEQQQNIEENAILWDGDNLKKRSKI